MAAGEVASAKDIAACRERRIRTIRPPALSVFAVGGHIQRLIEYFDLLLTLTHHRVRVRYKQSALGIGWALAQPMALMLIYTVIFSLVTRINSNDIPYPVFVYSALLVWTFFAISVTSAANGLVTHAQLVTKVYFPREILPLTYVFAGIFDLAVASVVLGGMLVYYKVALTAHVVWLIPILLTAVAFATALALFLSALQVWFRDIGFAMPLVMQVWMFATPVVYPLSQVPKRMVWWYTLNPMTGIVENFRAVIVQGVAPDLPSLEKAAIISFIALPISYLFFKHREATMADVI